MIDEGYTKYQVDWRRGAALPEQAVAALNDCRNRLYDAGLVGHYAKHNVGFGNISIRRPDGGFIISGTRTGHIERTEARHWSRVTECDIDANRVICEGPVQASSEALTHAAIYALEPGIGAIVHVHSAALWDRLLHLIPTTSPDVAYGTPEMAREFDRLYRETALPELGVAAMGGHAEGLVAFGRDILDATERALSLQGRFDPAEALKPNGEEPA